MMLNKRMRDITGHRSGRLVAVECLGSDEAGRAFWRCKCDCGGEKEVQANNILRASGGTQSCGCLRKDAQKARLLREGAWNEGKSYGISSGEHCYRTRHAWAKAVIRHYGDSCQRCGWDEARCDAHHRIPKSKGGLHTVANGIVLCPNCHRVAHERGIQMVEEIAKEIAA